MSSNLAETAKNIYLTGLRNQHAVENQAIELLERQVGRLENYPEMEARMRRHIEESRAQARRLEDLLSQHDTSHSTVKDTVMSMVGNVAALGHATASDEVVKNTFANFAFEHYEIASYKSLLTLADLAGQPLPRLRHRQRDRNGAVRGATPLRRWKRPGARRVGRNGDFYKSADR